MRGLLGQIRSQKWPALVLVVAFLLITVLVVPADSEINAQSGSAAIVQKQNVAPALSTDYGKTASAATSKAAATEAGALPQAGARNFTTMMSIVLLLGTIVNARLFVKINAKH